MPSSEHRHEYKLKIAGIVVQFIGSDNLELAVADMHRSFLVAEGGPDFSLRVHYGLVPALKLEERLFDSGSMWALYRSGGGYAIILSSNNADDAPYQVVEIDGGFKTGDLYIKASPGTGDAAEPHRPGRDYLAYVISLVYPLIMMNLLPRGRGVEFHACGVDNGGRGLIFSGTSGSGKSTIGRLWRDEKGVSVLSDERIIVRRLDGRFWMFGTPWKSDAGISSPGSVPLESIFMISHGRRNTVSPLTAGEAASRLFVRCFPTFWDEPGLDYTLDLIGQIAEAVPCFELGFVPGRNLFDFINKIISRETSP